MSAFEVMRRASLGVFGAVALASASAPVGAFALPRAVTGINVDVAPLRANAGDPTASWVARASRRARSGSSRRWAGRGSDLCADRLRDPWTEQRRGAVRWRRPRPDDR
jgi:hypothetical protein